MPTPLEYMQFSLCVYATSIRNRIADPLGWAMVDPIPDQLSGFSAGYFKNAAGNEIVISYTGTNELVDALPNWAAGLAIPVPQIFEALAYYFKVRAANPDANITFTGHSLGGGLASLMAVFLDKQAVVFDEAPFQPAAMSPAVLGFLVEEVIRNGYGDAALNTFIASAGLLALTRESNVTEYYVEGEVLSFFRYSANTLVGNDNPIWLGDPPATLSERVDRHSMALMTALWMSTTFLEDVRRLPFLVSELFDNRLFAADSMNQGKDDLLRMLLRHQLGVSAAIQPDGMLDRFAADLNTLAQANGGNTYVDLGKALASFAMEKYYRETADSPTRLKQLFQAVVGGLQFDTSDIVASIVDAKGYAEYFNNYLESYLLFGAGENGTIREHIADLKDWSIATNTSGMIVIDSKNRGALMLGGTGADRLTGGSGNDLLAGRTGDDKLYGGDGDDTLLGGSGLDVIYGDAGNDQLLGGDDVDYLYGGSDDDDLKGNLGDDMLFGDDGNDTLDGGDDNDILLGGDGKDTLLGGTGADDLMGGDGADWLEGGGGYDHFITHNSNRINGHRNCLQ